ncbi:UNVERIFIED_CONTAM: Lamin-like protein [Sesamum calycinum]|uniref:Lamin-like protein n=1 Tax=Sesamum calycinum TaxID=2727403 RepID=A0AAW2J6Y5_9LAMI
MAPKAFLIAVIAAILAIAAPASAAYDYTVGDDAGWKLGVNYTRWAEGKEFRVGDKLLFKYNQDAHSVAKVNASDFQQCVASNASNVLTSGNDEITLSTPGTKWYICSIADHCTKGMKLVITVSTAQAPAPAPTPRTMPLPAPPSSPGTPATMPWPRAPSFPQTPATSAAGDASPLQSYMWILGALAAFKVILVPLAMFRQEFPLVC